MAEQDALRCLSVERVHSRYRRAISVVEEHDVDVLHRMPLRTLLIVQRCRLVEDPRKAARLLEALHCDEACVVLCERCIRLRIERPELRQLLRGVEVGRFRTDDSAAVREDSLNRGTAERRKPEDTD